MIGARMKRIIIHGAMNHESGTEIAKLLTTTAGIQKKAWDMSAGKLTTTITPTPKTTAFTMQKISAATRSLARLSLCMAYPFSFGKTLLPGLWSPPVHAPAGCPLVPWRSAALIGRLCRRLGAFGLLRGRGLALHLFLSILRRCGAASSRAVHGAGRWLLTGSC
jgi:hypothetical protein